MLKVLRCGQSSLKHEASDMSTVVVGLSTQFIMTSRQPSRQFKLSIIRNLAAVFWMHVSTFYHILTNGSLIDSHCHTQLTQQSAVAYSAHLASPGASCGFSLLSATAASDLVNMSTVLAYAARRLLFSQQQKRGNAVDRLSFSD